MDGPADEAVAGAAAPLRTGTFPSRWTLEKLLGSQNEATRSERWLAAIAVSATIIAVVAIGFVMHVARPIMLPLAAAFIIATLLAPIADRLARLGFSEGANAAVTVFAALAALGAVIFVIDKPVIAWTQRLPEVMDEAREKLDGVTAVMGRMRRATEEVEEKMTEIGEQSAPVQEVVVREATLAELIATSARAVGVQVLFTFVLVYFLLATRTSFRIKAMAAQPTLRGKLQVARIFRDINRKVGTYMLTMTIINIGLGAAMTAAMAAIGMPSPVVWGVLAGVLNFVPYLGPVIVTALLAMTGVVTFETLPGALLAPGLYILLNFIESNVVTPAIIGVRMLISPLSIIVFIAFLAWLWGPVGAVLAIPLLVVAKTVCDSVRFLQPVGVFIGDIEVVKGRKVGFCRNRYDRRAAPRQSR